MNDLKVNQRQLTLRLIRLGLQTSAEIIQQTGIRPQVVRNNLRILAKRGRIRKTGRVAPNRFRDLIVWEYAS